MRRTHKKITHLLIDLDETLYTPETGLLAHIDRRIDEFLQKRLGVNSDTISDLRYKYYRQYGTTLRGVKEIHGVDPEEYCDYAYKVNLRRFLEPNPNLRKVLMNISARKAVFSNSPRDYIKRVIKILGLEDCFSYIFDIKYSDYLGKPNRSSYQMVLNNLRASGDECIFIDDQQANLKTAWELGLVTVQVGTEHKKEKTIDYQIATIEEIGEVWEDLTEKTLRTGIKLKKTGSDPL